MNGKQGPSIAPFAPQAFYPHFLNYNVPEECALGRSCAFTYIKACDEVYVLGVAKELEELADEEPEIRIAKSEGLLQAPPNNFLSTGAEWRLTAWVSGGNLKSHNLFREDLKRVYVCTRFREMANGEFDLKAMGQNTAKTLWICRRLIMEEFIAPIAPHAFYPYFWRFVKTGGQEEERFNKWFDCSKAILKICDAVYVYSEYQRNGCPKVSEGMKKIVDEAEKLGLEIQYRTYPTYMPIKWKPDPPRLE